MSWKLLSTHSPCSFPRYAVAFVSSFTKSLLWGVRVYIFPHVVHEFGDVYTFIIWGCLEFTVLSTAALPIFSYHGMHTVIFVRHIRIMNKPL